MNQNLGVDGNALFDDDAFEVALKISIGRIHLKIGRDTLTKISATEYPVETEVLKGMQIHQIQQRIIASRHAKSQSLDTLEVLNAFWTLSPQFTFQQNDDLNMIKRRFKGIIIKNFDILTGAAI